MCVYNKYIRQHNHGNVTGVGVGGRSADERRCPTEKGNPDDRRTVIIENVLSAQKTNKSVNPYRPDAPVTPLARGLALQARVGEQMKSYCRLAPLIV